MTDDKIARDTARNPERATLGPGRGSIRSAATRAARKVAKKVAKKVVTKTAQKKAARNTKAADGKTTKRVAKSAAAKVSAPASRVASARSSASKASAATDKAATKASRTPRVTAAAAASEEVTSVAAALPYNSGPAIETPRPPGPMHPGAVMDSMQEHVGGFGSLLALWGPLIIVAFLVLVFRGGEERESTVAAGPDVASQAAASAPDALTSVSPAGETLRPEGGVFPDAPMPGPPGTARGPSEAYDGGFTMRTSMATPVFAGSGSGTGMPVPARRLYPSPPGPYRDPRFRGLPTGESWSPGGPSEWMWSAEGRGRPGQEDGSDATVQWVRCAPPYYWCPAPSSPAW